MKVRWRRWRDCRFKARKRRWRDWKLRIHTNGSQAAMELLLFRTRVNARAMKVGSCRANVDSCGTKFGFRGARVSFCDTQFVFRHMGYYPHRPSRTARMHCLSTHQINFRLFFCYTYSRFRHDGGRDGQFTRIRPPTVGFCSDSCCCVLAELSNDAHHITRLPRYPG